MNKGLKFFAGAAMMLAFSANAAQAKDFDAQKYITLAKDATAYVSKRPAEAERLFRSDAVEKKIKEVKKLLKDNKYLAWMFENCFPNTIDTTVHFRLYRRHCRHVAPRLRRAGLALRAVGE